MAASELCPACGAGSLEVFHELHGMPAHSCLLLSTPEAARDYPVGTIRLAFCGECGFITNEAYDASLQAYSSDYEETQGFSAQFRAFADALAHRWVLDHDLVGKTVLEIGCGKGEFLAAMCDAGAGRGIGIDPSVAPERISGPAAVRIRWIPDFYSERYAGLEADAVVCRHTLEHIHPVADFMTTVRRAIGDRLGTVVLFEVPDVVRVLREAAFWDVYYEHCSYFSLGSLARLFRATGYEVRDLCTAYDDQYLLLEAVPASATPARGLPFPVENDMDVLRDAVEHFSASFDATVRRWRDDLTKLRDHGGRAVIWGAGSKGVAFLTALGAEAGIETAVDINPHKHGKYMAGTGHQIVGPRALSDRPPDLVVAMNPVYLAEIGHELDRLGVETELQAV